MEVPDKKAQDKDVQCRAEPNKFTKSFLVRAFVSVFLLSLFPIASARLQWSFFDKDIYAAATAGNFLGCSTTETYFSINEKMIFSVSLIGVAGVFNRDDRIGYLMANTPSSKSHTIEGKILHALEGTVAAGLCPVVDLRVRTKDEVKEEIIKFVEVSMALYPSIIIPQPYSRFLLGLSEHLTPEAFQQSTFLNIEVWPRLDGKQMYNVQLIGK